MKTTILILAVMLNACSYSQVIHKKPLKLTSSLLKVTRKQAQAKYKHYRTLAEANRDKAKEWGKITTMGHGTTHGLTVVVTDAPRMSIRGR